MVVYSMDEFLIERGTLKSVKVVHSIGSTANGTEEPELLRTTAYIRDCYLNSSFGQLTESGTYIYIVIGDS